MIVGNIKNVKLAPAKVNGPKVVLPAPQRKEGEVDVKAIGIAIQRRINTYDPREGYGD